MYDVNGKSYFLCLAHAHAYQNGSAPRLHHLHVWNGLWGTWHRLLSALSTPGLLSYPASLLPSLGAGGEGSRDSNRDNEHATHHTKQRPGHAVDPRFGAERFMVNT